MKLAEHEHSRALEKLELRFTEDAVLQRESARMALPALECAYPDDGENR